MSLENQLKEIGELKEEAFNILHAVSRRKPYNIYAIRELSATHSLYCAIYSELITYK